MKVFMLQYRFALCVLVYYVSSLTFVLLYSPDNKVFIQARTSYHLSLIVFASYSKVSGKWTLFPLIHQHVS